MARRQRRKDTPKTHNHKQGMTNPRREHPIQERDQLHYTSDTRYKAHVISYVCTRRQTHLYTEANTCLYIVKWVYTRRQTRLHEKTNVFALYLVSDVYCTFNLK